MQHEAVCFLNMHVTVRQCLTRSPPAFPAQSQMLPQHAGESDALPHLLLLVVDGRNDCLGPFNQPLPGHACPKAVPCSYDQGHCRQTRACSASSLLSVCSTGATALRGPFWGAAGARPIKAEVDACAGSRGGSACLSQPTGSLAALSMRVLRPCQQPQGPQVGASGAQRTALPGLPAGSMLLCTCRS